LKEGIVLEGINVDERIILKQILKVECKDVD
jgi:hypothetical protein